VHYSAGLAGLTTIAGAAALPGSGALWLTARLLLDGAGALFGLYLVTVLTLFLCGLVMRLGQASSARAEAMSTAAAHDAAVTEPVRP
jgi:hypothetical protein